VRLHALREHPEAFATSHEEARARTLAEVSTTLAPGPEHVTLGAFRDGSLVGIATVIRAAKTKLRHRATLAAIYVAPEARSSGLGRELLRQAIEVVRGWRDVVDLTLAVTVGNAARGLYLEEGFVAYAVAPRSLYVDGRFHDVEWMILSLEERQGSDGTGRHRIPMTPPSP
jgi:GNAT superfamily N-acetyltransferase